MKLPTFRDSESDICTYELVLLHYPEGDQTLGLISEDGKRLMTVPVFENMRENKNTMFIGFPEFERSGIKCTIAIHWKYLPSWMCTAQFIYVDGLLVWSSHPDVRPLRFPMGSRT